MKKQLELDLPKGTWSDISKAVTGLDGAEALRLLRKEAKSKNPRPYVMKRLYHRWRAVSAREDMSAIVVGRLPEYLK